MYHLNDTFNGREISSHRTVKAAVKAKKAHLRAVKRANGESSFLTYSITDSDGAQVDQMDIDYFSNELEQGR